MKKHLTADQLAQYAEYLQSDKKSLIDENILTHISECDDCAAEAVDFSIISEEILIETASTNKPHKKTNISFILIGVAASIIIFFGVWKLVEIATQNKEKIKIAVETPPIVTEGNDSIKQDTTNKYQIKPDQKDKEMIAASMITDPETEKIIENLKGNMRSDEIIVKSAFEIYSDNGSDINLNWVNNENTSLNIVLYNNELLELESSKTNKNVYVFKKDLKKGLYYWKLFNDDFDLIFCGKIIVKN